ncbi:hypothetical protein [Xenorhabdus anantnagensis]|uniref:Uncharacterized protein n=1 Tax=Xenorhabdus anantnagensis TaxID=3025875 RepID=A0ABT5LSW0_9GAMM|nr:hypothetical protein [Xenorhabdus anantnagensis]MDC9596868.1 hypothetical protein [Xenorhabdus anantnagensis]
MNTQKYQMAVNVSVYDENSIDFPSKKVWLDASMWLTTSQYIKINDFFLINKKFPPIEDLNTVYVTTELQFAIDRLGNSFPELQTLKNMDPLKFSDLMNNKMSYEYIYSQFDQESLKPEQDMFLISFLYNGNKYEVRMIREICNGSYLYSSLGGIYKEGGWHKSNMDFLTYRDYLSGKIDSYK